MPKPTTLVWLRHDLRLADHAALYHASERGAVVPFFVWAPEEEGDWPPGAAQRWWLHHALADLSERLGGHGSRLILCQGSSREAADTLLQATGADTIYWHTRHLPALHTRDNGLAAVLRAQGINVQTFPGQLLHDPDAIQTQSGGPYRVFTPFWKKLKATLDVPEPFPVPNLSPPDAWPASVPLEALDLLPRIDWASGIREAWTVGEAAAQERLDRFIDARLAGYPEARDRPHVAATSTLSPDLHLGALSPRQVWTRLRDRVGPDGPLAAAEGYLRQIAWREFSYHLLHHYPHTPTTPLHEKYAAFPWKDDDDALRRWQKGQTGYPIVDAGMRQLWHTGWMHNRVRMVVASFLTKDLLLPWQAGAQWFWDTLVDADLANNTMGWQWAAGCGADAQPFFRIFNPISQGERFDPEGAYVRHWVPELAEVPRRFVHKPWEAPAEDRPGGYPAPIVDHGEARTRALDAYQTIR